MAPGYLSDLLEAYQPARSLRSSKLAPLSEPKTRLKTFGDRSFSVAARTLWNLLPANIRDCDTVDSFKSMVKTHLFK